MISLWALLTERDVEAYAGTLLLPPYLAHLRLGEFRFAAQPVSCDGHQPLVLTYLGEGRLEELRLDPDEHALGMIQFVCPGVCTARLQLPRDDARWHWKTPPEASAPEAATVMRVYFSPTTQTLADGAVRPVAADAYVSVARGQIFVGRASIEAYVKSWLAHLGIEAVAVRLDFGAPSAGIEFVAGSLGGQLLLDEQAAVEDLVRFAGLEPILGHVAEFVALDVDCPFPPECGIREDGVCIHLAPRD